MIRAAVVVAVLLVLALLAVVVPAFIAPDVETYQLGRSNDHVPTFGPGWAPVDNVPTLAPGIRTTTTTAPRRKTTTVRAAGVEPSPYPTDELLYALAGCETGQRYDNPNTGNGYYGYFQFDLQTWQSVGGTGYPHEHPYEVQRDLARALILSAGWGRFPHCSRAIGAR